jgi:hypothetical protein
MTRLSLIAGAAVLAAAAAPAQAAPNPADALKAETFADLLKPIPDARTKLAALNAGPVEESEPVQHVQYYYHHHHHHHHHWRRRYMPPPWRWHHHHHHHHHHRYYREW